MLTSHARPAPRPPHRGVTLGTDLEPWGRMAPFLSAPACAGVARDWVKPEQHSKPQNLGFTSLSSGDHKSPTRGAPGRGEGALGPGMLQGCCWDAPRAASGQHHHDAPMPLALTRVSTQRELGWCSQDQPQHLRGMNGDIPSGMGTGREGFGTGGGWDPSRCALGGIPWAGINLLLTCPCPPSSTAGGRSPGRSDLVYPVPR